MAVLSKTYVGQHKGTEMDESIDNINSHFLDFANPHKINANQVQAIPSGEKGAALGVATLDIGAKILKSQLPTLNASDVQLSNVDNTSDINKPISTAVQSALETNKVYMDTIGEMAKKQNWLWSPGNIFGTNLDIKWSGPDGYDFTNDVFTPALSGYISWSGIISSLVIPNNEGGGYVSLALPTMGSKIKVLTGTGTDWETTVTANGIKLMYGATGDSQTEPLALLGVTIPEIVPNTGTNIPVGNWFITSHSASGMVTLPPNSHIIMSTDGINLNFGGQWIFPWRKIGANDSVGSEIKLGQGLVSAQNGFGNCIKYKLNNLQREIVFSGLGRFSDVPITTGDKILITQIPNSLLPSRDKYGIVLSPSYPLGSPGKGFLYIVSNDELKKSVTMVISTTIASGEAYVNFNDIKWSLE